MSTTGISLGTSLTDTHLVRSMAPLMPIITNRRLRAILLLIIIGALPGCARTVVNDATTSVVDEPIDEETTPPSVSDRPILTGFPASARSSHGDYENVWDRLRDGFALPDLNTSRVRYYQDWYRSRPEFLTHLSARARRYLFHITEEVEQRGLPAELALLPAVESAFKPRAYSRAHASGLWQFIPATGRRFGLEQDWWYDERRDVVSATKAALDYLEILAEEFDGDWFLALAAYNAGEHRVRRAMNHNRKRKRPTSFQALRLKAETKSYVPKLLALRNLVAEAEHNPLPFHPIPNQPYFAQLEIDYQIDLRTVFNLAGIEESEFFALNPGFKRWASAPDGPHRFLVPVHAEPGLKQALDEVPPSQRLRWDRHRIRRGETLSGISKRYGVDISALRRSNRLKGSYIRAGNDLMIPVSTAAINARAHNPRVVHRVRPGDTLWQIARQYGVYVKQLARWNGMRPNELLRPGRRIVIYRN